jgi:tricorn protease-like protein
VKVTLPGGGSAFGASGQVVMNPTWHPQGLTITEGSNQGGLYRLYIYSPGGASATELLDTTRAPGNLTFPHISPDGNQVAYVSDRTGHGDIYSWNRSTNGFSRITDADTTEVFPTFSPKGRQIAFSRKRSNDEDLFVFSTAKKTERLLVGGPGDQTRSAWVKGGGVVFFSSERGIDVWDLVHAAKDGTRTTLGKDVRLPLRTRPAVSRDGEWVAWVSADPDHDHEVRLSRVDGTETVTVQTGFVGCGEPALAQQKDRVLLAYTYLDRDADWRKLYAVDVTDLTGPPGERLSDDVEWEAPAEEPEPVVAETSPVLAQREAVSEGPDPWEVGLRYLKRVASAAIVGSAVALTLFLRSRRRSR